MEKYEFLIVFGAILMFFAVLLGMRFAWAVLVYDDWRCGLSECRIIKEGRFSTN